MNSISRSSFFDEVVNSAWNKVDDYNTRIRYHVEYGVWLELYDFKTLRNVKYELR